MFFKRIITGLSSVSHANFLIFWLNKSKKISAKTWVCVAQTFTLPTCHIVNKMCHLMGGKNLYLPNYNCSTLVLLSVVKSRYWFFKVPLFISMD